MLAKITKNTKKLFTAIMLITFTLSLIFIASVKATNYEWLTNGGFEDASGLSLITNGNFESGALDGSFSDGTGASIETVRYHSATHSLKLTDGEEAWMNFTATPISNLNEIGAWVRSASDANPSSFTIQAYYSDATFDAEITPETVTTTYQYFDWLDLLGTLQEGKELTAILIGGDASYGAYFDDVICSIVELGQNEITETTSPWYSETGDLDSTIVSTVAHSGNHSLGGTTGPLLNTYFYQDIDYLSSDHATSLSLWVTTASSGTHRVNMRVHYSDGSYQYKETAFNSPSVWSKLDFSSLIVTGKMITKISIGTTEVLGDNTIYIDDISLLADIPTVTTAFTFIVYPAPIMYNLGGDNRGWTQIIGTPSTLQCTLYDTSGETTENGTVTTTSPYMLTSFSVMTNGSYLVNIVTANRNFASNTQETLIMLIEVTDGRTLIIALNIYWITSAPTPTPTDTTGGSDTIEEIAEALVGYSVAGAFLFVPVWLLGFRLKGGKWGIIIGLVIGVGLGYTFAPNYVPIWLIFLVGAGIVGMFYSMKGGD